MPRLPDPRHAAQDQRGVLADQDRPQPSPRPSRQPHSPPRRLAGDAHLGTRVGAQKRETPMGSFAQIRTRVNELNEGPAVGSLPT